MELEDLNRMLDQLQDIYQQLIDNQKKSLMINPEQEKELRKLVSLIQALAYLIDEKMTASGINQAQITKLISEVPDSLPADVRKILKKAKAIKVSLDGCRRVLKEVSKVHRKEETGSESGKKRQAKFNRTGSKKGWIPL